MRQEINPKYYSKSLSDLIEALPTAFDNSGEDIFKGRNTIKKFYLDDDKKRERPIIVKRFKRPNIIQRIVYSFFKKSKARRAYFNGKELIKRGFQTPENIAFLETREWGLLKYGFYLTTIDSSSPINDEFDKKEFNKELANAFAHFAAELHCKGVLHHDLNSTNVLFQKDCNGKYSFSLIDINRMDFSDNGKPFSKSRCFDNMTRFTGRMDLYEYVLHHYIEYRGWHIEEELKEAIKIKTDHDKAWRRRKDFFAHFKKKRQ